MDLFKKAFIEIDKKVKAYKYDERRNREVDKIEMCFDPKSWKKQVAFLNYKMMIWWASRYI